MELKRGRTGVIIVPLSFFFLCFLLAVNCRNETGHLDNVRDAIVDRRTHSYMQGKDEGVNVIATTSRMYPRRLGLQDSEPPNCTAKCDDCSPCSPVLVSVPPVTPTDVPYYPEVWRCKCGDKLYVP